MKSDCEQQWLFEELDYSPEDEWISMPEYDNAKEQPPVITVMFKFKTEQDYETFKDLVKKHLYEGEKPFDGMQRKDKKVAWYPHKEKASTYEYE